MAKRYPFVERLASRLAAARKDRALSYAQLGALAEVDRAQAYRICLGQFATLNPGVLRICSALGVAPEGGTDAADPLEGMEAQLAAEAIAAWDRTKEGAQLVMRVLRALRPADGASSRH